MSTSPLVSVYITNYNYDQYLSQAIESVLEQTFQNLELIIIDDGSTDSSRKIIEHYQDNPRIRIIYHSNRGLTASINIALRAARGKYVMRLDADDFLDPNALLVMTEVMELNPDLALVFPDYYYVDTRGMIIGQERRNNFEKEVTLYDLPAHGACTLYRSKVLMEVGAYNDKYSCQDGYEIWLKLIQKYPVKNINLPLFYYRQHSKSMTKQEERILNTRLNIKREHIQRNHQKALKCLAVVPVRGRLIDPECPSLENLGEMPILEWTLREADKVSQIYKKVISTPDQDIIKYIGENKASWIVHKRNRQRAMENMPLHQTLLDVLQEVEIGFEPEAIVQLTPDSPFRKASSIEEAIHTMRIFDVDIVIGVIPEDGQFYWHRGGGLESISNLNFGQDLRLERERLYRLTGGLQVISAKFLRRRQHLKRPKVGHIILDRRSTIEVTDTDTLQEAQRYI